MRQFGHEWRLVLVAWGVGHCETVVASSPSFCGADPLMRLVLRAIWGQIVFFANSLCLLPPCTQSWYTQSLDLQTNMMLP